MSTAKIIKRTIFAGLAIALGLSACIPGGFRATEPDIVSIQTAAAQTVSAQLTLSAGQTAVAQLTSIASTTSPVVTVSPAKETPISTEAASETPTATPVMPTATPTASATATATATSIPCDRAQFIQDVTVPDGTAFLPGAQFTKVWRIKNSGSCTWNTSYGVVFDGGDRMSSYNVNALPGLVAPGQTIDIQLILSAPVKSGHYRSYWKLVNSAGRNFGIGANADKSFWADIYVMAVNGNYDFDFAAHICAATWRSSAGNLPCPGDKNSPAGSAILLQDPTLETGKHENEATLWTRPQETSSGWISGAYPSYTVKPGDHFMADIGCLEDSQGCDVTFTLDYQVEGKAVKNLGAWREKYDGTITRVDVDLSALAGKSVHFILGVTNNGKPNRANAFWLVPSIRNTLPKPTATLSPTATPNPNNAVQAAVLAVAQESGLNPNQVSVQRVIAKNWKDSCLGVILPDQVCLPMIIPGYRIILFAGPKKYEAHTNLDGSMVIIFEI